MAEPSRTRSSAPEQGTAAHVLLIEARFYDAVMDHLLGGAKAALDAAGSTYDVVTVPGALEIPAAVAILVGDETRRGQRSYDAVVALGCVIRGETYHFEIVANESARGLIDYAMKRALPLGNAILTVENMDQALVRADPARGNKGGEAVEAALSLLRIKRSVAAA